MFPKLDRERSSYGVMESYLARYYTSILSLPEKEKQMLKHWKNPNFQPQGAPAGDFVGTLVFILSTRCKDTSSMTINEINDFLDNLSTCSAEEKSTVLANFIQHASVMEQKWGVHVILRDLKLGISHEAMFKAFDPRALEVYNATSSLVEVCNFLRDPCDSKYANSFFQIFSPIKPMLAGRMSLNDILMNFSSTPVICETKYDGERIQCHFREGDVKFFTRNAVDYTYLYGPKFADLIPKCVNARAAILDGEIVVWDKTKNSFAPFGENKSIANSEEIEKCLIYMIFDILYLVTPKGEEFPLTSVVLTDRKSILKKIINAVPKKLEVVEGRETNSVDEIMNFFNESIIKAEEGIIVKKRDSIYKPDERGSEWIKMKSEYLDTLIDTLDLVIVGGYYGEGRRAQGMSYDWNDHINCFLLGVVKKLDKENPKNSVILPIVKVGTGYSQDELEVLRQRLKCNWKKFDIRYCPAIYGNWNSAMSDRPDVYIDDPSESLVLEVKGAELTPTETFPAKVTIRFPRVVRIRYDKTWLDAMKYEEVLKFYDDMQHNHILNKRKLEELNPEDLLEKERKRKKTEKFTKILDSFRDTDTNNIHKVSNIFYGFEFLILNLDQKASNKKKTLECYIVEYGGNKVQNFLPTTTHVISDKMDIRVQNILKTRDINIYNSKWVYDCVKYNKLIPPSPIYMVYSTEETKNVFFETMDRYNDSFFDDVNHETLKELFSSMKTFEKDEDFFFNLEELKKEFKENDLFNKLVI